MTDQDLQDLNGYSLQNSHKINVLLGKNGCGKSYALKSIDQHFENQVKGLNKYITPERGGHLQHNPGVEENIQKNSHKNWLNSQLRQNQFPSFKYQSIYEFRKLRDLVRAEIDNNDDGVRANLAYTFQSFIDRINTLLPNIYVEESGSDFIFRNRVTYDKINASEISSGESELITLAIECLAFEKQCNEDENNILLLDEPDLHLHPDLQVRFGHFLKDLVENGNFFVLLATHSTAFLGAFLNNIDSGFESMSFGQTEFCFKPIDDTYNKILPIFGAHPLSNLFNEAPILLVEGEDEERIWQQAIRTSESALQLYPCSVGSKYHLKDYEDKTIAIINSVYEDAKAYSLRDRDENPEEDLDDRPPLTRFRLSCRNSENLILCDEVLETLGTNWEELKSEIEKWLQKHPDHEYFGQVQNFKDNDYDRKNHDIKEFRNIIVGLADSKKNWEKAVGQTLGKLKKGEFDINLEKNKIADFLGKKMIEHFFNDA